MRCRELPPAVVETRGRPTSNTQPLGAPHVFEMARRNHEIQAAAPVPSAPRHGFFSAVETSGGTLLRFAAARAHGIRRTFSRRPSCSGISACRSLSVCLLLAHFSQTSEVGLARASKAQRGAGSGSSSARGMQRHHSLAFATSTDEILLRRVSHTRASSNGSGIAGGGEKRTRDADDLVMVRKLFGALA